MTQPRARSDSAGVPESYEMKSRTTTRHFLVYAFLSCCVLSIVGCMLYTTKYSRGHGPQGCSEVVFNADLVGSDFCCDDSVNLRDSDWICVSAFDSWNKYITRLAPSIYLPLLPWLVHFLSRVRDFRNHPQLLKRLGLYISIILIRMYGLYRGLSYIQFSYFHFTENDCWYSPKLLPICGKHNFDFSDHIVFYMVQVVLPIIIELVHVFTLWEKKENFDDNETKKVKKIPVNAGHILILCYSFVLLYMSLRAVFFTCIYFHTPMECAISLGIVFFTYVSVFLLYL